MPTAKFKTTVRTSVQPNNKEQAVANCARYLGYADQTDTFGLSGYVESAVFRTTTEEPSVTFLWTAPVSENEHIKQVENEMDRLHRVELHICLTNPNL
jgi:hypothetical protein